MPLKRVTVEALDERGLTYIKGRLLDSDGAIASWLNAHMSWDEGQTWGIYPAGQIDRNKKYEFNSGGLIPVEVTGPVMKTPFYLEANVALVNIARETPDCSLFLFDDLAVEGKPSHQYETPLIAISSSSKEVFAVTKLTQIDGLNIQKVMLAVGSWGFWGFSTTADKNLPQTLSSSWLDDNSSQISMVFAEAYDHESFIFWQRANL